VSRRSRKQASVDLVPDEVWAAALRQQVAFVLHHVGCGVMRGTSCDCAPLFIGSGFGIDSRRASA